MKACAAQALGGMTSLQSIGVSQCSGVTGDGLLELIPCWPALTRLTFNCLHLTADHIQTLIKVPPLLLPCTCCCASSALSRLPLQRMA